MANKSIIDVEINDESFKEFYELYKQYEDDLENMPNEWAKVSDASKESIENFGKAIGMWVDANRGAASASHVTVINIERAIVAQKQFGSASKDSGKQLDKMAKSAKSLGDSIFGIGKFLLGFGSFSALSGLATSIGGMFGLDRLAGSAIANQRSALGLGLTTGQQRAFQTDMGRYLDPGILSSVANAQNSYEGRVWLARATGMSSDKVMSTDAGNLSSQLAIRAHDWWRDTPESQRTDANLSATGFTQSGLSLTDMRRLGATNRDLLVSAASQYRSDSKSLNISDKDTNALYDFSRQLELAGKSIETYFTGKLAQLGPSIGKFITNLEKDAEILLDGILTPANLKAAQEGFEAIAKYLGSDEFRKDLRGFVDGLKEMASAIKDFIGTVKGLFHPSSDTTYGRIAKTATAGGSLEVRSIAAVAGFLGFGKKDSPAPAAASQVAPSVGRYANLISSLESSRGLPKGLLGSTAQVESSWNTKAISPAGAQGLMQLMPAVSKGLGVTDPFNPEQSLTGGADLYQYLLKRYKGDIKKAVAAYNWNPNALDRDIQKNGDRWEQNAPQETQNQIRKVLSLMEKSRKVEIVVTNKAGANVAVSANAAGI